MQASDNSIVVVGASNNRKLVEDSIMRTQRTLSLEPLYISELESGNGTQEILNGLAQRFEIIKILDKYCLVFSENVQENVILLTEFFNYISKNYDQLVDVDRNVRNISGLLQRLFHESPLARGGTILDFGCGIGLSLKAKENLQGNYPKFNLIGFDRSSRMLSLAKKAGLKTFDQKAFGKIKDNTLDGAIASYVMHFIQNADTIELVWSKIKYGGCLIANFHKDIGVKKVISIISALGGNATLLENAEFGSVYAFRKPNELFIKSEDVSKYATMNSGLNFDNRIFTTLVQINVIPVFKYNEESYVLKFDVNSLLQFISAVIDVQEAPSEYDLYSSQFLIATQDTRILLRKTSNVNFDPFSICILRNILNNYNLSSPVSDPDTVDFDGVIHITTTNSELLKYIKQHTDIKKRIESARASNFSNSASYMGSKKGLRSFIVEGISNYLKQHFSLLDIMCGSGAVSGAASLFWNTYSSDAMGFSRILAKIQGGGFSLEEANQIIEFVSREANSNFIELKELFEEELSAEDEIFHSELDKALISKYASFCSEIPISKSKFRELYEKSKSSPGTAPYLLFTCSYSNLYLGLRQAVEIDNYRFAIDKIEDNEQKDWALGALITTLSAIGNTYAGHFAQPKYKDLGKLSMADAFRLMEQRNLSVGNEFAARLREFALESQVTKAFEIYTVDGPWRAALKEYSNLLEKSTGVVYLDAPYTRDEYSRYYHLLETLVKYDYPVIKGIGRVPDKLDGKRFGSEFFTKTSNKLKSVYVSVVREILEAGHVCAWSYSDSATIPPLEIISEVYNLTKCDVRSYATPYLHQAQGGNRAKRIIEYLIIFNPKTATNLN